jgi:hypothetical protein
MEDVAHKLNTNQLNILVALKKAIGGVDWSIVGCVTSQVLSLISNHALMR